MQDATIELITNIVMVSLIGTWVIIGIAGFFLFHLWGNVASKRKWFPRFLILEGVLFVVIATATTVLHFRTIESLSVLLFLLPVLALIAYLGKSQSPFCHQCGAVIYDRHWPSRARFCRACGAALGAKSNSDKNFQQ